MRSPRNDNGGNDLRVLEARFHPNGQPSEFVVIGKIYCRTRWAILEVAPDFEARVSEVSSASTIVSNLAYLTMMSRPRPFESLLSLENRHWSFVATEPSLERSSAQV